MAKCHFCSAPLLANSNTCRYCNIRNDVDLKGKHDYQLIQQASDRLCPHCEIPLQTLDLQLNGPFLLDQCKECYGLFFDTGQLETLLEKSVAEVFHVNLQHLDNINQDRFQPNKPVKYIKCPECNTFMRRHAFAYRSGVIIDQCDPHGIWLDSGEITHLMEWKRAGGQVLSERQQYSASQTKKAKPISIDKPDKKYDYLLDDKEIGILDILSDFLGRLLD